MFHEAKTTIRQRDWLTLVGEKIRREQVRTVPSYFFSSSREQIRQVENGLKAANNSSIKSLSNEDLIGTICSN